MARTPKNYPELDAVRDLMGTMPDAEIAERAKTSAAKVGRYRRKHGIKAYEGYKFGIRDGAKAEEDASAPKAKAKSKSKAKAKSKTKTKTKAKAKAKAKAKKVKAKKTVKPKRSANDPLKTSDFAVGMEVEVRGGGNETWYGEVTKVRQSNAKCPLEVAWLQKEGSGFIYYDCAHKDVIELRTVLETHEAGHFAVPAGGRSACSKCKEAGTTCSKRVKK